MFVQSNLHNDIIGKQNYVGLFRWCKPKFNPKSCVGWNYSKLYRCLIMGAYILWVPFQTMVLISSILTTGIDCLKTCFFWPTVAAAKPDERIQFDRVIRKQWRYTYLLIFLKQTHMSRGKDLVKRYSLCSEVSNISRITNVGHVRDY